MCAFRAEKDVEEKMPSAGDNIYTNTRVKPVQIKQHTGMTGARPSAVLLSLVELRVGNSLAASASLFYGMDLNFFDILPSSNWTWSLEAGAGVNRNKTTKLPHTENGYHHETFPNTLNTVIVIVDKRD